MYSVQESGEENIQSAEVRCMYSNIQCAGVKSDKLQSAETRSIYTLVHSSTPINYIKFTVCVIIKYDQVNYTYHMNMEPKYQCCKQNCEGANPRLPEL